MKIYGVSNITSILVLNNKSESLRELLEVLKGYGVRVEVKEPMEPFNPESYKGLIISGGAIPRQHLREYLEWYCRLYREIRIPVLAICLGLRILGYCHGLRVRRLHPSELGVTKIFFHREYPLAPSRRELLVYENHDFEILNLKPPIVNYASSERCKIQAVKLEGKPFFAVQFHPEITEQNEGAIILENFVKLCRGFNLGKTA